MTRTASNKFVKHASKADRRAVNAFRKGQHPNVVADVEALAIQLVAKHRGAKKDGVVYRINQLIADGVLWLVNGSVCRRPSQTA